MFINKSQVFQLISKEAEQWPRPTLLLLLAFTSCLLITFVSPGQAVVIDRIVAVINGQITTLSELQELEYSLRTEGKEKLDKDNPELTSTLLDELIDKKLQLQLAAKKKIGVSEQQLHEALADIKRQNNLTTDAEFEQALAQQGISLENFTRQLKENIQITILVRREVMSQIEISEEEVKNYYQEHKAYFSYLDELRAQHILLYLAPEAAPEQIRLKKELADEVWKKLQAGADFVQMAKQYSDDTAAEKGGDLGYFRKGEMIPVLEEAALDLEVGGISPILRSNFGFHIIKLTEHRKYNPDNSPRLREEVEEAIYHQKSEGKLKKWLKQLRQQAKIKIML